MIEIETKLKGWGNSVGIIVPQEKAVAEGIEINDRVKILMIKEKDSLKVKDIFGTVKFKTKTRELLKEIDKEFE